MTMMMEVYTMTVKRKVMTIAMDNSVLLTPTSALPAGGDIGAVNKYNKNTTCEAVPVTYIQSTHKH